MSVLAHRSIKDSQRGSCVRVCRWLCAGVEMRQERDGCLPCALKLKHHEETFEEKGSKGRKEVKEGQKQEQLTRKQN